MDEHTLSDSSDQSPSRQVEEFLREKRSWEVQRDREAKQIEDQVNQLTEAWLRLEVEQREFLEMRSAHRLSPRDGRANKNVNAHGTTPSLATEPAEHPSSRVTTTAAGDTTTAQTRPITTETPHHASGNRNADSAVLQFERLKREFELSRNSRSAQ